MVARAGQGARLEPAPGGLVTLGEVFGRPVRVSVVAQGEDPALDAADETGGRLIALPRAVGAIARRDDHRSTVDLRGRRPLGTTPGDDQDSEGGHHLRYPPTGSDTTEHPPVSHRTRVT